MCGCIMSIIHGNMSGAECTSHPTSYTAYSRLCMANTDYSFDYAAYFGSYRFIKLQKFQKV